MIVSLTRTTSPQVLRRLLALREESGSVALGRVLTFVIHASHAEEDAVIEAANSASREHPMRIVLISEPDNLQPSPESTLDAEIRIGGDAGASEVVILRPQGEVARHIPGLVNGLLLPDAPVVAWWPSSWPHCLAESDLGGMAQRRILDSAAQSAGLTTLQEIAAGYRPGDTDLAWGRISGWRTQLAATLDYLDIDRVTAVEVSGVEENPSVALLAGWLALCLGAPTRVRYDPPAQIGGVYQVSLTTEAGAVQLTRLNDQTVQLEVPGQPTFSLFMPRRSLASLLAEELRRLSPDSVYGDVLLQGLTLISPTNP